MKFWTIGRKIMTIYILVNMVLQSMIEKYLQINLIVILWLQQKNLYMNLGKIIANTKTSSRFLLGIIFTSSQMKLKNS